MITIPCNNVIPKSRQNKNLLDEMEQEAQAFVCSLLIPAVQRVVRKNYEFIKPAKCVAALEAYKVENSPVREFFVKFCALEGERVSASRFMNAFRFWYASEVGGRNSSLSAKAINKELCNHLHIPPDKLKAHTRSGEVYCFSMNSEADEFVSAF